MTRVEASELLLIAANGGVHWWEQGMRERVSDELRLEAAVRVLQAVEKGEIALHRWESANHQHNIRALSERIAARRMGWTRAQLMGSEMLAAEAARVIEEAR